MKKKHISDDENGILARECKRFNHYLKLRQQRDVTDGIWGLDGYEQYDMDNYDRSYEDDAESEHDDYECIDGNEDIEMEVADSGKERPTKKGMKVKVLRELLTFLKPLTRLLFTSLFDVISSTLKNINIYLLHKCILLPPYSHFKKDTKKEDGSTMSGIANSEIDLFIRSSPTLKKNYCGVYAIDELIDNFVECVKKIASGTSAKLPFAVVNTDPIVKSGTHRIILFDSFGLLGLQTFITSNDTDLISRFLTNFVTELNEEFEFYSFTFDADKFLTLTDKEQETLTETCIGLMLFISAFAVASNSTKIKVYGMIDQLQLRTTSTCGGFALQFLKDIYYNTSLKICRVNICTS